MKTMTGKVVSTGMTKTIVVEVTRYVMHPMYKKNMRRSRKFKVHSEDTSISVGDTVKIGEVAPISKYKHFTLVEKITTHSV